jgi:hypothetical protein
LTFPGAGGQSGAGSYVLVGTAEWTLTDRIVDVVRERHSPQKTILGNGLVNSNQGDFPGNHYISVAGYPNSITLTPGLPTVPTNSAWQNQSGQWQNSTGATVHLGRITDGSNYLEVTLTGFSTQMFLTEVLPGDFNDSGVVDAADYVVWRKAPGNLGPFLTNFDVWRSNFGDQLGLGSGGSAASTVPESSSLLTVGLAVTGLLGSIQRRVIGRAA